MAKQFRTARGPLAPRRVSRHARGAGAPQAANHGPRIQFGECLSAHPMPSVSPPRRLSGPRARWLAAASLAAIAVALRAALQPALGDELPFIVAAPVSLFCAVMWGAGPGVVAMLVCLAGALLPGIGPDVMNPDGASKATVFSLGMALACVLIARVEALRRREDAPPSGPATPLVRWLNAALLGAILVPATAFVAIGWWTYQRAVHSSRETVVRRADLIYEHAQRTFDLAQKLAVEAATLTTGDDDLVRANESDARQRLNYMLIGLPSVVNLNVWNAQGVPLVRSDRATNPTATVADREYFRRQTAEDRGFDVSEVLKGRQTGRELFNLTHRRPAQDGAFTGIVAVSMSPEYFRDYYRAIVAQNTDVEAVSLVRTDGAILARWPALPSGATTLPSGASSLAAIRDGQASGVVFGKMPGTGEKRVGAFRRLEGLPVYVLVGFSEASMMAGWVRTMGILAAMALPITLMLIAVTAIARRRVLSEQLAQQELHEQTQLRAASEKNALEAHRRETLAALTGGVAHDFNNLLAIVSNSLSVQNVRHPDQASEPQIAAMRRAVQSGTRLTRQLLSLTRKQALRPEVIDLQVWLPELQELLKTTLGSRIELRVTVAPDLPPVLIDSAELELALVNLAVNAKHAVQDGGSFALSAELYADAGPRKVVISAVDNGAGIPPEVLSRVTEPFFTTKAPGSGSGLGLYQVRAAMDAAGGSLQIQSEVGRGTTIKLMLPALDVVPAGAEQTTSLPEPYLEKLDGHVLVAEDNDDVAAVTTALVASLGLRVTRATNAAEALKLLLTPEVGHDIGFLLTDVVMPGEMDGVQLALKVRAERPALPITVITGYAENLQSAQAAKLDVVQKPLSLEELLARFRAAFPVMQK